MDKLVSRVTLVEGSGPGRKAETLYEGREEEFPTIPIDSIVRSVTVVEGSRGNRTVKVVFKSRHWEERDTSRRSGESGLRRFLRADMIRAQDTYQRHLDSTGDDKQLWWLDIPATMVRAFIKAGQEEKHAKSVDNDVKDVKDVKADMRDLQEDLKAAGADIKRDIKTNASDTKSKVKGK